MCAHDDEDVTFVSSTPKKKNDKRPKRRVVDDSDSDFDPDLDVPNMPSSANGSSASASGAASASDAPPPRRSTRIRKKPHLHINDPIASSMSRGSKQDDDGDDSPVEVPNRLEQIDPITPEAYGLDDTHPTSRMRVAIHPVAMAMISLHAHLTRTEVIGYLGGAVYHTADATHLIISEAFPAQGLNARALARSGRSAYTEVEIDPESSVEVMTRLSGKGLSVVGWYHSHPDARFTVDPSRVDIENQANYQRYIFKDQPFVAAIIAPYNEQLPDFNPDLLFFQVHDGAEGDVPLRLPYKVDTLGDNEPAQSGGVLAAYAASNMRFPVDAFVAESLELVTVYSSFGRRVRLQNEWRGEVSFIEKLRNTLLALAEEEEADGEQMLGDKKRLVDAVQCVMQSVDMAWAETARKDEERLAKNREARKRKRGRKK